MSQRKVTSIEKHGGGIRAVKALAIDLLHTRSALSPAVSFRCF